MLQSGLVSWRRARNRISANAFCNKAEKILGHFHFIEWLLAHFIYLKTRPRVSGVTYDKIKNLHNVLVFHYRGIPPVLFLRHLRLLRRHFSLSSSRASRQIFDVVVNWLRPARYERRLANAGSAAGVRSVCLVAVRVPAEGVREGNGVSVQYTADGVDR